MSPQTAAMAAVVEPVSGDVVHKVEEAAVAAHSQGVSSGMNEELARCNSCLLSTSLKS